MVVGPVGLTAALLLSTGQGLGRFGLGAAEPDQLLNGALAAEVQVGQAQLIAAAVVFDLQRVGLEQQPAVA